MSTTLSYSAQAIVAGLVATAEHAPTEQLNALADFADQLADDYALACDRVSKLTAKNDYANSAALAVSRALKRRDFDTDLDVYSVRRVLVSTLRAVVESSQLSEGLYEWITLPWAQVFGSLTATLRYVDYVG